MGDDFRGLTSDELLRALDYIDDFIENIDGGDSFWVDPDGGRHDTDVGYGYEFWNQVYEYLVSKLK